MVKKLTILLGVSGVFGLLTHAIFYPLIESWNNERVKNLGRSGIGVAANLIPFAIWYNEALTAVDGEARVGHSRYTFIATLAYMASFVFFGAGAILGYLFDDWRNS